MTIEKLQPRKTKRPMPAREMVAKFKVSERSVVNGGLNPAPTTSPKTQSAVISHGRSLVLAVLLGTGAANQCHWKPNHKTRKEIFFNYLFNLKFLIQFVFHQRRKSMQARLLIPVLFSVFYFIRLRDTDRYSIAWWW